MERRDLAEILVNPDQSVWIDVLGRGLEQVPAKVESTNLRSWIKAVAALRQLSASHENPLLETTLPSGERFSAALPPAAPGPMASIRFPARRVWKLEDYVGRGELERDGQDRLDELLSERRNIVVAGGTSSGKTTFANALLQRISVLCPKDRVAVLEDTPELQVDVENYVRLQASSELPISQLVRFSLRARPDRIIVGEVRGEEARDLLLAWNTGHAGGLATVHANSARDAFQRLVELVSMHPRAPRHIEPMVTSAVHAVVFLARKDGVRRVESIYCPSNPKEVFE